MKGKTLSRRNTYFVGFFILMVGVVFSSFLFSPQASAATLQVDSILDTTDNDAGNGTCDDGSGNCTLRAAIEEANMLAGSDTINFAIAGAGVHRITLEEALPVISETVVIDGTSQPGASCGDLVPSLPSTSNTPHSLLVEVTYADDDASSFGTAFMIDSSGLGEASNTVIRGLVINHDTTYNSEFVAINVGRDSEGSFPDIDVSINCNYIGTNATGTATLDSTIGVSYGSIIEGLTVTNNLISTSVVGVTGVNLHATTTLSENLIGTDVSGEQSLGQEDGINGNLANTTIQGNVISGNTNDGVRFATYYEGPLSIVGNYIGLSVSGLPLGNQGNGVRANSSSRDYQIGGDMVEDRNVISANGSNGVRIYNDLETDDSCSATVNERGSVQGNYIGTDTDGQVAEGYGNNQNGVQVNETTIASPCGGGGSIYRIEIGGGDSTEGNVIAGNGNDGVQIFQSPGADVFGVSVIGNSIFGNENLGINLAQDSANDDAADVDTGPNNNRAFILTYPSDQANNYINYPVINSSRSNGTELTINYDFTAGLIEDSEDGSSLRAEDLVGYRLDFYLNDQLGNLGYGEGKQHIGSFIVDGSEDNAEHVFSGVTDIDDNLTVSATATVLWRNNNCTDNLRRGNGPPYVSDCE
jgi:CSLREA domain-containing protein